MISFAITIVITYYLSITECIMHSPAMLYSLLPSCKQFSILGKISLLIKKLQFSIIIYIALMQVVKLISNIICLERNSIYAIECEV